MYQGSASPLVSDLRGWYGNYATPPPPRQMKVKSGRTDQFGRELPELQQTPAPGMLAWPPPPPAPPAPAVPNNPWAVPPGQMGVGSYGPPPTSSPYRFAQPGSRAGPTPPSPWPTKAAAQSQAPSGPANPGRTAGAAATNQPFWPQQSNSQFVPTPTFDVWGGIPEATTQASQQAEMAKAWQQAVTPPNAYRRPGFSSTSPGSVSRALLGSARALHGGAEAAGNIGLEDADFTGRARLQAQGDRASNFIGQARNRLGFQGLNQQFSSQSAEKLLQAMMSQMGLMGNLAGQDIEDTGYYGDMGIREGYQNLGNLRSLLQRLMGMV